MGESTSQRCRAASSRVPDFAYDFTYMWNLKNKVNEQVKQKQTHRYREQTDGCQMGGELGVWVKKVKGLSTNW